MIRIIVVCVLLFLSCYLCKIVTEIRARQEIDSIKLACQNRSYIIRAFGSLIKGEGHVGQYFSDKNYRKIAIYGYGVLGKSLHEMLIGKGISVTCIIDKNANSIIADKSIPIYGLDANLPELDVVVVTAVFYFDDIKDEMMKRVECPVLSVEEIAEYEENKNNL